MFEELQQNLNKHLTAGVLGAKPISAISASDDIVQDQAKVEAAKLLNQDAMKALTELGTPKNAGEPIPSTLSETARNLDP